MQELEELEDGWVAPFGPYALEVSLGHMLVHNIFYQDDTIHRRMAEEQGT